MTEAVQKFIKSCVERYPMRGDVLEVGSMDVNGSPRCWFGFDPRDHTDCSTEAARIFKPGRFTSYVGVDMRKGPGVDRVMRANNLLFKTASFDVVLSAEMIEHDDRFWQSALEMERVLRPGGYLILTTRSWRGCPPHSYPNDYWRFLDTGLQSLMGYAGIDCLEAVDCESDGGVFAIGQKAWD